MTPRKRQVTYSSRPNHAARAAHRQGARQFKTYDTSALRPKKSIGPKIFAAVLAVVVIGGMIFGVTTLMKSCSPEATLPVGETVEVVVPDGSGAKAIGKQLQEAGLIGTSAEFTKRVSEIGAEAQLCSGTYTFTGGMTVDEMIGMLRLGPPSPDPGVPMTIPEGFTVKQIASRVEETTEGRVTAADFIAAASDASVYAADFPFLEEAGTKSLEGFLFPKTYDIPKDATADSIIRRMLIQYQTEISVLDYSYAESQGLSQYEVLILASIVEKEADNNTRERVAAVFLNRLRNTGAPTYGFLGSDATTAYEIGGDPNNYDFSTESPYNTRVTPGLTPTPISSPGLASLQAVCAPEPDFEDYYFFSFWPDSEGNIQYFFDKTHEEHMNTVAQYS